MTPDDARPEADEIGAPELPLLCPDHAPVIRLAAHLEHVGDHDVMEAAESKASQCPTCYAQPNECPHRDRGRTHYATQGATQFAHPSDGPNVGITSGPVLPVFHGLLCDACARKAGLSPVAFGRGLDEIGEAS